MKKIIIVSYFFSPCNLTAAQRTTSWANYLSEFGYYPVIISRNWDIVISSPEDVLVETGNEIIHEKNELYESYYLPYLATRRDKIYSKNKQRKIIQKVSKVFTFKDLILENYRNKSIPFSNFYDFLDEYLNKDKSVVGVIISGNPYTQFKFGFKLKMKYNIKWIADYRDEWNTSGVEEKIIKSRKIISTIQSKSEKKWLSNCECITSVSQVGTMRISNYVNRPGYVILNGYDNIDTRILEVPKNIFSITYNGSLYPTQPVEVFLNAFLRLIEDTEISLELKFNFPGLAFDKIQEKRVKDFIKGKEKYFEITNRVPKNEVLNIQKMSDVLLMISHKGVKGIPSSKLYEYVGLQKRVLLYPNDNDIIEKTLNDVGNGIICDDEGIVFKKLKELVLSKQNGTLSKDLNLDQSKVEFYSRRNQTKVLAELMDNVF